ncbi:MAG: hypothetical protein QOH71_1050 [Blastocatellia bacterium]|jgi:hypothetical protein|nr:hypothetical protein [Blastocatellia bacterium]
MTFLLLLPLLLMTGSVNQDRPRDDEAPPVVVTSFRLARDRKPIENALSVLSTPAPAMIAANKNFEKQRRINAPAGERDPNADTLDGRSAEIDRIVQQSREPQPVDGFSYSVKVQNRSAKLIQTIFWEYQFTEKANPVNVTRRQFLCSARISPDKGKDLQAFSLFGPSEVVNVKSLGRASADQFSEGVVINRVEYSDGSFWQRRDWNVNDLKLIPKARSETRNMPACRSL